MLCIALGGYSLIFEVAADRQVAWCNVLLGLADFTIAVIALWQEVRRA